MTSLSLKFLLACVVLGGGALLSPVSAQQRQPEGVVRDFYRLYLQSMAADRDLFDGDQATLKQYTTSRFLGEINKARKQEGGIGADPFLLAQDFDKAWAKNINAAKPLTVSDVAFVEVTMKGPEMGTHNVTVKLRQEDGHWKIDSVKPK